MAVEVRVPLQAGRDCSAWHTSTRASTVALCSIVRWGFVCCAACRERFGMDVRADEGSVLEIT